MDRHLHLRAPQRLFAPLKQYLPQWGANAIRSLGTILLGPIMWGQRTGFFSSAWKKKAVNRDGDPIPWYTYPCIDFLSFRNFDQRTVLEFGGGQSTLWWAKRSKRVITFEGDREWYLHLKAIVPANVELHLVTAETAPICASQVTQILQQEPYCYDVIIIDGLFRFEMIEIACRFRSDEGVIICDDSEGYGFHEGFKERGLKRIDFHGNAPGVVLPHCTSVFFNASSFIFDPLIPIQSVYTE